MGKNMTPTTSQHIDPDHPAVYQIRLVGRLDSTWADWFGGLAITLEADGTTLLAGPLDQAALHGVLKKARDLGLPLLAVNTIEHG